MEETTQMITRPLETIEGEILFYKQQTAIGIMEIGKRLIEAKAQMKHGEWGVWLEEKVEFTQSTANKFMKCASEFSNSESVRNLGSKKLFLLLSLPLDEREEFISAHHEVNGETKTVEDMTTRELQQAIKEKKEAEKKAQEAENKAKQLEQQLEEEKTKPKEKEIVTKTVEVDKTDPLLKIELDNAKKIQKELLDEYSNFKTRSRIENERLKGELQLEKEMSEATKKRIEFLESKEKEYGDLQKGIYLLTKEKDSISRQVSSGTELSGLIFNIQSFINEYLAPISYSRALRETHDCDVVQENLIEIIEVVEEWCREMRTHLINKDTSDDTILIEGEVIE
jgi:Protein of unknown function (DUF3102).